MCFLTTTTFFSSLLERKTKRVAFFVYKPLQFLFSIKDKNYKFQEKKHSANNPVNIVYTWSLWTLHTLHGLTDTIYIKLYLC